MKFNLSQNWIPLTKAMDHLLNGVETLPTKFQSMPSDQRVVRRSDLGALAVLSAPYSGL